jgi:hypothetical protein
MFITMCLQGKLEELEKELTVINENSERLKKSQAELVELQLVLEKAGEFFDDARASAQGANSDSPVDTPLLDDVPVRCAAVHLCIAALVSHIVCVVHTSVLLLCCCTARIAHSCHTCP